MIPENSTCGDYRNCAEFREILSQNRAVQQYFGQLLIANSTIRSIGQYAFTAKR
ncbi:hypothetical protein QUB68_06295 [Microcoleus sp. A006_D1]|uniref:hypothetical protein n=1 Tax=Microcoleus sp. A006_D1 TaxID=3055267 RepID=UPI002FD4D57A